MREAQDVSRTLACQVLASMPVLTSVDTLSDDERGSQALVRV